MARIALRLLLTAVLFGIIWACIWPIFFDQEIRHGINPHWGKIQIYTDTVKQKVIVRMDNRTEELATDSYEQSPFYKEARNRLRNAGLVDETRWHLRPRSVRAIVALAVLVYIAAGRLMQWFEEPPRPPSLSRTGT